MVERHDRLDAVLEQGIDDALVEVETLRIRDAVRRGHDARHGNRETVGIHTQIVEQRQILPPTMV